MKLTLEVMNKFKFHLQPAGRQGRRVFLYRSGSKVLNNFKFIKIYYIVKSKSIVVEIAHKDYPCTTVAHLFEAMFLSGEISGREKFKEDFKKMFSIFD